MNTPTNLYKLGLKKEDLIALDGNDDVQLIVVDDKHVCIPGIDNHIFKLEEINTIYKYSHPNINENEPKACWNKLVITRQPICPKSSVIQTTSETSSNFSWKLIGIEDGTEIKCVRYGKILCESAKTLTVGDRAFIEVNGERKILTSFSAELCGLKNTPRDYKRIWFLPDGRTLEES